MDDGRYGRFKRLWETYQIDPAFRKDVEEQSPGLFPAGEERLMREAILEMGKGRFSELGGNIYFCEFRERNRRVSGYVEQRVSPSSFREPQMYAYLQRIRNRCRLESSAIRQHPNIFYYPLAFELSQGCRVGCSFCGLMAERWVKDAPYEQAFWKDILAAAGEYLGGIAGDAPCYFATEPLDHPDYERFLMDMDEVLGEVPQTTTAVADREEERIHSLIRFLGEERLAGQARLRLSVRSIGQFRRISQEFSPEELANVELLPNNKESLIAASDSGRNRPLEGRKKIRYSICCVSGVKVNLATRRMIFLEPVLPDEEHPCGYRIRESVSFADQREFAEKLAGLYRRHACERLPDEEKLILHPYIQIEPSEDFLYLKGDGVGYRIPRNMYNECMISALKKGGMFEEIIRGTGLTDSWKTALWEFLNQMFQKGYVINI